MSSCFIRGDIMEHFVWRKVKKGKSYFSRKCVRYDYSNSKKHVGYPTCVNLCPFPPLTIVYHLHALSLCPQQETPSSSYLLILLFSPGSFYQFGVEHLLPAVLALAICPPLKHSHTKQNTSHPGPPLTFLSPLPTSCAAVKATQCKLNQIHTGKW